jgi:hypothetical protein
MMGQLEGRAEEISGEFNSQEVANTLWSAYFFACIFPGVHCDRISSLISTVSRLVFMAACDRPPEANVTSRISSLISTLSRLVFQFVDSAGHLADPVLMISTVSRLVFQFFAGLNAQ